MINLTGKHLSSKRLSSLFLLLLIPSIAKAQVIIQPQPNLNNITGILPVANGGTGKSSWNVGIIPCTTAATTFGEIASAAAGQVLISGGAGSCGSFSANPSATSFIAPLFRGALASKINLATDTHIYFSNNGDTTGIDFDLSVVDVATLLNRAGNNLLIVKSKGFTSSGYLTAYESDANGQLILGNISSGYPGINFGASGSFVRFGKIGANTFHFADNADTGGFNISVATNGVAQFYALGGSTYATVSANYQEGYVAKTATYIITLLDSLIDCTSGTFDVTLPTAVGITGRIYTIKNSGVGTITLEGNGTETIDGALNQTITTLQALTVVSNGANWIIK